MTQVSIFFKDTFVEAEKRVETYTYTDFLALCGGLLGLFLGISLLSLVEIIYFATLRLFWIIRRPRPEHTETSPPDISFPKKQDSDSGVVCDHLFHLINTTFDLIFSFESNLILCLF